MVEYCWIKHNGSSTPTSLTGELLTHSLNSKLPQSSPNATYILNVVMSCHNIVIQMCFKTSTMTDEYIWAAGLFFFTKKYRDHDLGVLSGGNVMERYGTQIPERIWHGTQVER